MIYSISLYRIGYLPHSLSYRFSIQPSNFRHSCDPPMSHLLGLKRSKKPPLPGIHQAHQQVDLLVQYLLWVFGGTTADRAGAVYCVQVIVHDAFLVFLIKSMDPLFCMDRFFQSGVTRWLGYRAQVQRLLNAHRPDQEAVHRVG
jgi:hypothetical protein